MSGSHDIDERYDVTDASILLEDTWASEDETVSCERCGTTLDAGIYRCTSCNAPVPVCVGICSACVSPRCVGNGRGRD